MSLREVEYVNLLREDGTYQKKTRTATHQPRFTLKVPGEKHTWTFTGCLNHPEFLHTQETLRRVVVRAAPDFLSDNISCEDESNSEENTGDAEPVEVASGQQPHHPATHRPSASISSPHHPATQRPPKVTHGKQVLIQVQQHHTPKSLPLDGSPVTARDKRQKATTARRSQRRMAKR